MAQYPFSVSVGGEGCKSRMCRYFLYAGIRCVILDMGQMMR